MSIATLKRKTQSTYKVNSGTNSGNVFVISMRGINDCGQVLTTPSAGFSLNGSQRNRSYIGKGYSFSNRPGKAGNYCCADTSHTVKPSVKSNRAVINNRRQWKKTPFTDAELGGNAAARGKLQKIYNNWVQVGINGGILGSSSNVANSYDHFYEKKNQVVYCNTDKCATQDIVTCNTSCKKNHPYTKYTKNIIPSSKYNVIHKVKRAGPMGGYSKPFPYTSPLDGCKPIYTQANHPNVLNSYYKDRNTVHSSCPSGAQGSNNSSGTACVPSR